MLFPTGYLRTLDPLEKRSLYLPTAQRLAGKCLLRRRGICRPPNLGVPSGQSPIYGALFSEGTKYGKMWRTHLGLTKSR